MAVWWLSSVILLLGDTDSCWESRIGSSMIPAGCEEPGLANHHELNWFSVLLVCSERSYPCETLELKFQWEGFQPAFTRDQVFTVQIWKATDHWTVSYCIKVSIRYLKKKFPRWRADSSPGPKNINNFSLLPVQHSIKKTFFKLLTLQDIC